MLGHDDDEDILPSDGSSFGNKNKYMQMDSIQPRPTLSKHPSMRRMPAEGGRLPQMPSRRDRPINVDDIEGEDSLVTRTASADNNPFQAGPGRPTLSKYPSMRRMPSEGGRMPQKPRRWDRLINVDDIEGQDPFLTRSLSADNNPYLTGPSRGVRREASIRGVRREASQASCEMLLNVLNPLGPNSTRSQSMGDCSGMVQRRRPPGRGGFQLEKEPSIRDLNRSLQRQNSEKQQLQQMQSRLQSLPPSQLLLGCNDSRVGDDDSSLCSSDD